MKDTLTFDETKPNIHAVCPFCQGTYHAGETTDEEMCVLHSDPPCKEFLENDIITFLEHARLAGVRTHS